MMNVFSSLKKEFSFSPEIEPVLEHRLFRLLCLTISFISFFLLIPSNVVQRLPGLLNLPIVLLGICSFILYRQAVHGRHYHGVLLVLLVAAINAAWFFNGGMNGSVVYFIFPVAMFPLIVYRGRKRWISLAFITINGCLLIWVSYRYPWIITPYNHPVDRVTDLIVGMVISIFSCTMILWVAFGATLNEHERLRKMNERMEHEISERKRREEEIRSLAREHRLILSTMPLGIVFIKQRVIQWANPAFEKMFGYTLYEMIGMEFASFYGDDNYERIGKEGYPRVAEGEQYTTEALMKRKDDTLLWCSMTGRAISTEDPGEGTIWMVQDISERRQAEENLTESEARYRSLVELSPDAIIILSGEKIIFFNSRAALMMKAARPEDLYGKNAYEFVHPDYIDFLRSRLVNAYRTGEPNPLVEAVFLRMDGSSVEVEISSVPIHHRGGKALQVFMREITERKKLQQEMLKAQKLESLGMLAGGIAHDFNNLLTGIMGNISLAKFQIEPSHISCQRLEQCEKAAVQASRLTKQLLTFAHGGEPVRTRIDVFPLINDAVSFSLRGSEVKTSVEIDEHLWSTEADSGQISQVFHNILYNAAQAMPNGGEVGIRAKNVRLSKFTPMHLPAGPYVKISIEDRGCGIVPENMARIFDPYFTTKSQGSGLGLASAYSIVKRHGGVIDVTSKIGKGSCFTVYLPASFGSLPVEGRLDENVSHVGSGKILLMDDEQIVRETVSAMLETFGYQVELCADGAEAVDCFRKAHTQNTPFRVSILDLTVPGGMGGKEAAGIIKELDQDAVLVVASGYSNDQVVANFREYGFSGAVPKPFTTEKLARELETLLAPRRKRGAKKKAV